MEVLTFWLTVGGLGLVTLLVQRAHRTSTKEHAAGREIWERVENKVDGVAVQEWQNGLQIREVHTKLSQHIDNPKAHQPKEK